MNTYRNNKKNDISLEGNEKKELVSHPLAGELIDGSDVSIWLKNAISENNGNIDICSAFLRSEALEILFNKKYNKFSGRILTRWKLNDFLAGASDLDSYLFAKKIGLEFYVLNNFHGKVFSFQNHGIISGSANATLAGLGLKDMANREVCTLTPFSKSNQFFINKLFNDAIKIDDSLFE